MDYKLGFIGCGNMAKAMINGVLSANIFKSVEIAATDKNENAADFAAKKFGIKIELSNKLLAEKSDIIILAVKPMFYKSLIEEISESITSETVIISITPGISLNELENYFNKKVKLVRAMPNTPAMVGEGMTAYCHNKLLTENNLDIVNKIFSSFGKSEKIDEYMMDAVVAVSGSSPAYVYIFMEAMADAAVKEGMPRDKAYTFAAQAVLGSAKMLLETGKHPGELKDMVCSPAGTTIEAVKVLEEKGFRGTVMCAMEKCAKKSRGE